MKKWEYKSPEWIRRVREEDYNETKTLSPKELIDKIRKAVENTASELDLKVVRAKIPTVD